MTHLTPDELIDALEGTGTFADRSRGENRHLAACAECRRQLADLEGVLGAAKQASVPEPSPMFWPHFSQRVSAAIEHEPALHGGWRSALRWQVLLPLGAVAVVILALMISIPKIAPIAPVAPAAPVAPVALATSTDSWDTVVDLVGELDVETASAAGVIGPGVAERAVLELTAEEQQELTRLLKEELTRAKS